MASSAATVDKNFPKFDILADLSDDETLPLNQESAIPDNVNNNHSLKKEFTKCSDLINKEGSSKNANKIGTQDGQVFFTSKFEIRFYHLLTDNIIKYGSPRLFQIDNTWVDQRTLSYSFMPGGWLNIHVMDAFVKMFPSKQEEMLNVDQGNPYDLFVRVQYFEGRFPTKCWFQTRKC
uniref:Uncharacterized protein n=1 Tax=Arundo donax TaxID=35708 RepID=A0A0A9ECB3_ARUDO